MVDRAYHNSNKKMTQSKPKMIYVVLKGKRVQNQILMGDDNEPSLR
jgi:hypothetical protein